MNGHILRLTPKTGARAAPPAAVELELSPWAGPPAAAGGFASQSVFNKFPYSAELEGPGTVEAVYINGVEVPELYDLLDRRKGCAVFTDYFGYVRFTVELRLEGGAEAVLYTKLVPVFVDETDEDTRRICRSMSQMADYIYEHCEPFWREDQVPAEGEDGTPSLAPSGLKLTSRQSLASQLQLLHGIVRAYEKCLPFFRTGSRYRVRPEKQWVDFERASHLNSGTFRSILQRPDRLMETGPEGGIPFRGKRYVPTKVMAAAGRVDYDIYENRYVLGFLRYLVGKLGRMAASLEERLAAARERGPVDGCVDSSYFIYGSMPQRLREGQRDLEAARLRISELYAVYDRMLAAGPAQVRDAPRPTAIFRSVHYYREIYDLACQWFRFGVYDFRREDMILPFVEGHKLYEYYVLIKLLRHLEDVEGFELIRQEAVRWVEDQRGRYRRTVSEGGRSSLFVLRKGDLELTVVYQPHIFRRRHPENLPEIELFRNNSYRPEKRAPRGGGDLMYDPDYAVKLQRGDGPAGYVILDAKFSNLYTAHSERMPSLAYKYLFALSPDHLERGDKILGLSLIYGKPDYRDRTGRDLTAPITSGYDMAGGADVRPFVRLIALRPENEGVHAAALAGAVPWRTVPAER